MAANERKILTTLTIGGEKEFNAAMQGAYSNMKVLSSELKANSAEFDKNNKSVENLTKRDQLLRQEIIQQKEIVNALSGAVDEATKSYTEDSKITDEYKVKLNNAQAALSNMERDLKENNKTLADAKSKTKALSDGLKEFGDNMKNAGEKITSAGQKLSVLSAAAAAAGAAIVKVTTDSGKWADALSTQSAQTGIATETLQKWTYAAKFIDTEVDTMTGSMVKMVKQMDAARNGTKLSEEAFRKLKIKVVDSNGSLRDSETVFMEAIDALGKMTNETDRDALALQIFGKSAQELNPLIKAGSEELKRLGEEAEAAGVIIGDDGVKRLGKFDDAMQRLGSQVTAAKNKLAIQLAPTIEMIVKKVTGAISAFGDWVKTLDSGTIETVLKIGAVVAAAGPALIMIGKISQGIGALSKALSLLIANPMALTITAVVGLTAALVAWAISMQDSNTVAGKMSKIAKERTQEIKDQKQAYDDLKNSQAEQAQADLAQIQNTENLWAELQTLADESGRVNEQNRARATFILGELNSAYGTEYTLVDGMITRYQTMQTEIDNLIEKRKYEIVQKAALPLYEKAITDEINMRMQAERDLASLEDAKAARDAEYTRLVQKYGQERVDAWLTEENTLRGGGVIRSIYIANAIGDYESLSKSVDGLETAYTDSTAMVKSNLSDQTIYQQAELLAQQGHWEEAYATLSWYSSESGKKYQELQGDQQAQRVFLENEYRLAKSALETYLVNVQNKTEAFNESTLRSLTTNASNAYTKGQKIGANVGDGMINGMDNKKFSIGGAINSLTNWLVQSVKNFLGIRSPSTVMRDQIGKQMMLGWRNGITENAGLIDEAIKNVYGAHIEKTAKNAMKKIELPLGAIWQGYGTAKATSPNLDVFGSKGTTSQPLTATAAFRDVPEYGYENKAGSYVIPVNPNYPSYQREGIKEANERNLNIERAHDGQNLNGSYGQALAITTGTFNAALKSVAQTVTNTIKNAGAAVKENSRSSQSKQTTVNLKYSVTAKDTSYATQVKSANATAKILAKELSALA